MQDRNFRNVFTTVSGGTASECSPPLKIHAANGRLSLVVPLKKWSNHTPIHEIQISYEERWALDNDLDQWKGVTTNEEGRIIFIEEPRRK